MKVLIIIILLISQYFLYRVAFPKKPKTIQDDDDTPRKRERDISEVVVTSRFVRPDYGQSQKPDSAPLPTELQAEKPAVFAAGNEKRDAVIPPEKIDEIFAEDPDPADLEIDLADDEPDEPDLEDESDDLQQSPGGDAELADGLTIEEMTETVEAIDVPSDENARLLYRVDKTDMFEKLVSGDEGKAARIRAIIDRYVQSQHPEVETKVSSEENTGDNEWENFDVLSFLD
jgi:hypothetical protein